MSSPRRVPASLPAVYGSYVLLKELSDAEDQRPVYLMALSGSDKPWALKVFSRGSGSPAGDVFRAEAKILARMSCPFLVGVLDSAEVEDESSLVMGHVPGRSLDTVCRKAIAERLTIPLDVLCVVVRDLLEGLTYLHAFEGAGLAHGNVSARTILVSRTGFVRLAGFRPGSMVAASALSAARRDLRAAGDLLVRLLNRFGLVDSKREPSPLSSFVPPAVATILGRILDDRIGDAELAKEVREFATTRTPTEDARQRVTSFLGSLFEKELAAEATAHTELQGQAASLLATVRRRPANAPDYPDRGSLLGEYRVVRPIGEGGMGRVYEGLHEGTGRRVALKVLHPSRRTPTFEERFRREAQAATRIKNEHVVSIEHFGPTQDGKHLFLAMEFLPGKLLADVLAGSGPLEVERALAIAAQICDGVAAAHAAGVIHRDLKPGNIMLFADKDGGDVVKILDLGLARLESAEVGLTLAGDLLGTLVYAAPEQGLGKPATPLIDVYALGEILYEMLTGKLPHSGGDTVELLRNKATIDPPLIHELRAGLPANVSQLVMRALARDPEERTGSAAELGRQILSALEGDAPPAAGTRALPRWAFVGAGALAVVLGCVVVTRWLAARGPEAVTAMVASSGADARPELDARAVHAEVPADAGVERPSGAGATAPTIVTPPLKAPTGKRPAQPRPEASNARMLLRSAEKSFEEGDPVGAIELGRRALEAGAGVQGNLAMGKYYTSMRLHGDALRYYRAALKLDPNNETAKAAISTIGQKAGAAKAP